jgi:hypothetical protein
MVVTIFPAYGPIPAKGEVGLAGMVAEEVRGGLGVGVGVGRADVVATALPAVLDVGVADVDATAVGEVDGIPADAEADTSGGEVRAADPSGPDAEHPPAATMTPTVRTSAASRLIAPSCAQGAVPEAERRPVAQTWPTGQPAAAAAKP